MLFISSAYAQEAAATAASQPSALAGFLPLIIMVALFYFLLIRPQQRKINEHKKMVNALRKGDKILTGGGIYGTVTKVEDDVLHVEIASHTEIRVARNTIISVVTRTEPADSASTKS